MIDLKQIRQNARGCVKRHYVLLTLLCAISIFVGTEFNNVLNNAQTWYEFLRGRQIQVALEGIGIGNSRSVWLKVVSDVIDDNIEAGNIRAAERMALIKQATSARSVLGRQRGVLAALVYKGMNRTAARRYVKGMVTGFCSALFNTIFFMGLLVILFSNTTYMQNAMAGRTVLAYIVASVGINAVVEMVVAAAVTGAAGVALKKARLI